MTFYREKSDDGSDMREEYGMFVSPDGETWGSKPFTEEQKVNYKTHETFWDIMNLYKNELSFEEMYEEIKLKKSTLSRKHRDFVIKLMTDGKKGSKNQG